MGKIARTWRIRQGIARRVKAVARAEGVYDSDVVNFVLHRGLQAIEDGEWRMPTRPAGPPLRLDWSRLERESGEQ
jgi:hypothetical protein